MNSGCKKAKAPSAKEAKSVQSGWRSFIMRSVHADQAARARVTAIGETLH